MEDPTAPFRPDAGLRCGIAALVGRANAGKSTLLNRVLEEKVSIVSPVVQTTRNLIRGVLTEPRGQIVFLDTPGVHKPFSDLGKIMNRLARASVEGVDLALLVLDASTPPGPEDEGWMRRLLFEDCGVVAVLNKSDRRASHASAYRACWDRVIKEKGAEKQIAWMPASALKGDGLNALIDFLFEQLPVGPLLFPEDMLSDFPRKLIVSDIIREKYFEVLHDELPHSVAVGVDTLHEDSGHWTIQALVYVDKPSQKGIVLGKKGRLLKHVREQAKKEIAELFDVSVKLELWVKIEKNWSKNHFLLKQLGHIE